VKKSYQIDYKNFIQKKHIKVKLSKNLNKNYNKIYKKIINNLDDTKNTLHTLSKKFKFNFKIKELNRFKKFKTIAIIGMGGSILGSEAIYFFLKDKIKKDFLFLDNIDEEKINKLKKKKKLSKILFIIISKSGSTVESLSNVAALDIVSKNSKNIILISEKNNNFIHSLSQINNLYHIEHKSYIGGRYSVLSEVGMVPAYLMGINISKLRKNLIVHFKSEKKKFLKDSTLKLANILKTNKIRTLIFFNYIPQLNKFLYWCQQLIAESLGKNGYGFLPVVSPAPKDHHSLLQLYLDGPKDKLFYIFSSELNKKLKINSDILNKKFSFLQNKSLGSIKIAQKKAFIKALEKKNIPYREFKIKKFNEEVLGELFAYFLLETALTGKIVNLNPFDQPAVEQVKINTKKILI